MRNDKVKKKPAKNQSEKFDTQKIKENQDPSYFGHKQSKEETYETKKNDVSKEETYEPKKTDVPKGNPADDQRI
jgi:hypothetical protein